MRIGIFTKSGSRVKVVGSYKDPIFGKMLSVERIDTGKGMSIPEDAFEEDPMSAEDKALLDSLPEQEKLALIQEHARKMKALLQ